MGAFFCQFFTFTIFDTNNTDNSIACQSNSVTLFHPLVCVLQFFLLSFFTLELEHITHMSSTTITILYPFWNFGWLLHYFLLSRKMKKRMAEIKKTWYNYSYSLLTWFQNFIIFLHVILINYLHMNFPESDIWFYIDMSSQCWK